MPSFHILNEQRESKIKAYLTTHTKCTSVIIKMNKSLIILNEYISAVCTIRINILLSKTNIDSTSLLRY